MAAHYHGRIAEAEATIAGIEAEIGSERLTVPSTTITVVGPVGLRRLLHALFVRFPRRTILGAVLMLAQAFLYNSIFFSYGMILTRFHGVSPTHVGLYIVPFAIGNFAGPLLLGPLFDRWGRRVMIPATYALSGLLLVVTGVLFAGSYLTAFTQALAWSVVFFVGIRGRELRVPDGQRAVSGGAARDGDRGGSTGVRDASSVQRTSRPRCSARSSRPGSRRSSSPATDALAGGLMIVAGIVARVLGVAAEGAIGAGAPRAARGVTAPGERAGTLPQRCVSCG